MCEFFDKDIKYPKWSCVLNCCSECPGVFVPNAETNCDQDVGLPFIHFNRYKNIGYFYLNKNLLSEHCKTCTSWINLEILGKERLTHGNIRNWKFWFSFNTVLHPWKKICACKRHDIFVSWYNKNNYKYTHDYKDICQVLSGKIHSQ